MKKSFVLYHDQVHIFNQLPDDKAGILIKKIFDYCSSSNNTDSGDAVIEMAFTAIKTAIDRDIEKYESICKRNKNNGSNGGRPSNPKKPSGLSGNRTVTKKPDNDNDNDSDNVNGSDTGSDIFIPTNDKKQKTYSHDELKTDLISKINESGLDQYQDSLLSFFEYRMAKPKKDRYQTPTGLAGLIRKAHGCIEAGYNLNQCIQYAIETERWLDINPEYFRNVFGKKMGTGQSNQAAIEQIMNRINNS